MNYTGMSLAMGLASMLLAACAPGGEGASAEMVETSETVGEVETSAAVGELEAGNESQAISSCNGEGYVFFCTFNTYQDCVNFCGPCGVRNFNGSYCSSGPPLSSSPGSCACG
jgi:hypothetical protein